MNQKYYDNKNLLIIQFKQFLQLPSWNPHKSGQGSAACPWKFSPGGFACWRWAGNCRGTSSGWSMPACSSSTRHPWLCCSGVRQQVLRTRAPCPNRRPCAISRCRSSCGPGWRRAWSAWTARSPRPASRSGWYRRRAAGGHTQP